MLVTDFANIPARVAQEVRLRCKGINMAASVRNRNQYRKILRFQRPLRIPASIKP